MPQAGVPRRDAVRVVADVDILPVGDRLGLCATKYEHRVRSTRERRRDLHAAAVDDERRERQPRVKVRATAEGAAPAAARQAVARSPRIVLVYRASQYGPQ